MNRLFALVCIVCFAQNAVSADLIVEEFGLAPTYSSIAAAVAAAADGDRIIIKNRAGDIPWIENITIGKSLTFLSYSNNTQFVVQGNYTINMADGRTVNIIGMKNTSGSILKGTGTAANRGTDISIMDSWFILGNIDLDIAAMDVQVIGNRIDAGYVQLLYGNVIGNDITYSTDVVSIVPGTSTFQGDTCHVIGNKINCTGSGDDAIIISGTVQVYHVKNNWIQHRGYGINLASGNGSSIPNHIWNNTISLASSSSTGFGIYVQSGINSIWEIMNNILDENSTGSAYGIYNPGGSGQVNVYYNVVDPSFDTEISGGFTFTGNNNTVSTLTFNGDGTLPAGNPGINGGNPAQPYYDLDLTVGDAGAYGGSYTLNNFFPLFTGAARVYFVKYPFNVRQGSTLSVKAFGYDR